MSNDYKMSMEATMGLTIMGLCRFAQVLIENGRRRRFTVDGLQELKAICIRDMKNTDASGLPIEYEAELFRQALGAIEHLIDDAIVKGWK